MVCFGNKKVLILIVISMFNYSVLMGAEGVARKPLSLLIAYQQKIAEETALVDNGAVVLDLMSVLNVKTPALLVSGVVARSLMIVALAGYLQEHKLSVPEIVKKQASQIADICGNIGISWEDLQAIGGKFFVDYAPYLVKASDLQNVSYADDERPFSHERFVLFLRNDKRLDIERALNMNRLLPFYTSGNDLAKNGIALLQEIENYQANPGALARTISSIFNRTQTEYSWNITIAGHGQQMKQLDKPLLTRITPEKDEGMIANMPPRQFGMLLDFFNTMPVNILVLASCYSGGYNASLVEQELKLLNTLTGHKMISALLGERAKKQLPESTPADVTKLLKKQAQQQRQLVLVSLGVFDELTFSLSLGEQIQLLDVLFDTTKHQTNDDLKKGIEKIFVNQCDDSVIVLMPDSNEFELLANIQCFNFLIWRMAMSDAPSMQSLDILSRYVDANGGSWLGGFLFKRKFNTFKQEYQKAFEKHNWESLLTKIMKEYPIPLPLFYAIQMHNKPLVDLLLKRDDIDVNAEDEQGQSTLLMAIATRQPEIVDKLITAGADAKIIDENGNSLLRIAIQTGQPEIVDKLITAGANAKIIDENGNSLLRIAIQKGQPEIVDKLIAAGVDANEKDSVYGSILRLAIERDQFEIVDKLLAAGANPNVEDSRYSTILGRAIELDQSEIIDKLLAAGADANAKDIIYDTILKRAIANNQPEIIDKLLAAGADANAKDSIYGTILKKAISDNQPELVGKLLAAGADANAEDSLYGTILERAMASNQPELVGKLLAAGADANTKDSLYGTQLMRVIKENRPAAIVQLLLDYGASVTPRMEEEIRYLKNPQIKEMIEKAIKARVEAKA